VEPYARYRSWPATLTTAHTQSHTVHMLGIVCARQSVSLGRRRSSSSSLVASGSSPRRAMYSASGTSTATARWDRLYPSFCERRGKRIVKSVDLRFNRANHSFSCRPRAYRTRGRGCPFSGNHIRHRTPLRSLYRLSILLLALVVSVHLLAVSTGYCNNDNRMPEVSQRHLLALSSLPSSVGLAKEIPSWIM